MERAVTANSEYMMPIQSHQELSESHQCLLNAGVARAPGQPAGLGQLLDAIQCVILIRLGEMFACLFHVSNVLEMAQQVSCS